MQVQRKPSIDEMLGIAVKILQIIQIGVSIYHILW